jgi:hypothetical protein
MLRIARHVSYASRYRLKHHPRGAIVFMHGLGDKPESWQVLLLIC